MNLPSTEGKMAQLFKDMRFLKTSCSFYWRHSYSLPVTSSFSPGSAWDRIASPCARRNPTPCTPLRGERYEILIVSQPLTFNLRNWTHLFRSHSGWCWEWMQFLILSWWQLKPAWFWTIRELWRWNLISINEHRSILIGCLFIVISTFGVDRI